MKILITKKIVVIKVDEGGNKPYSTNQGIYLTKAGSDKRKISPQELRRLFAESKNLYPDEEIVHNSTIEDIDIAKLKKFLKQDNIEILQKLNNNEPIAKVLKKQSFGIFNELNLKSLFNVSDYIALA